MSLNDSTRKKQQIHNEPGVMDHLEMLWGIEL